MESGIFILSSITWLRKTMGGEGGGACFTYSVVDESLE